MTVPVLDEQCSSPAIHQALTAYSFGELAADERQNFALHLIECDVCWEEVRRLEACVSALRQDPELRALPTDRETVSVLGLAGGLDHPFGGHVRHVFLVSTVYALLYVVPVLVEVAYQFDRFGSTALRLAPLVFGWMTATTILGLWVDVRSVRGGKAGLGRTLAVWMVATVILCLALWPSFPGTAAVEASFGTWPVNLGYLKSVFYAWMVGPLFILWPFHFIVVMQRELSQGRCQAVAALLSGDKTAVPPRGTGHPPVWTLVLGCIGLVLSNYIGVNHLFEGLRPNPYANLFRSLVLVRVTVWMALAVWCTWWYARRIDDVKREAIGVGRLLASRHRS